MDHHIYNANDIQGIIHFAEENQVKILVTTEKDEVKLSSFMHLFPKEMQLMSLCIEIDFIEGKEELHSKIMSICRVSEGKSVR